MKKRTEIRPVFEYQKNVTPSAPKTRAGSILATRNLAWKARLQPTQKIIMLPRKDRLAMTMGLKMGESRPAHTVTLPCRMATGLAEKSAP